jgi:hypothetical protein
VRLLNLELPDDVYVEGVQHLLGLLIELLVFLVDVAGELFFELLR